MKQYKKHAIIALASFMLIAGLTPLAAQSPLQSQTTNNNCTNQACIDTLQAAPGLQSQSSNSGLQSATNASPQDGDPLQATSGGLNVVGSESFEPSQKFDASLLWLGIICLALGAGALVVLVRLLKAKPSEVTVVEPEPEAQPETVEVATKPKTKAKAKSKSKAKSKKSKAKSKK